MPQYVKNMRLNYTLSAETHFKHCHRLKIEGERYKHCANTNQKKAGILLISDKADFRIIEIIRRVQLNNKKIYCLRSYKK